MKNRLIKVGEHVVNLSAVASAHWEGRKLFVHLIGGRFLCFNGDDAQQVWDAVCSDVEQAAGVTS